MKSHQQPRPLRRCTFAILAGFACIVPQVSAQGEKTDDLPPVRLEDHEVAAGTVDSYQAGSVKVGAFRDVDPVDVPISVNVLTRELLDAQNARSLYDALRNTAGVTRSQISGSTYDNLAIRGILVENRGNYRLNGSLPVINLIDLSMENKERVEVLKGASGLYYGFVPPSGIINMVTKRAGAKPVTTLTTSINSEGGFGGHIDIGRRLGAREQVGLRVNIAASKEDIGIDNFKGGRRFGSLALDWKPGEKILFRFDIEHIRKDVTEQAAITMLPAVGGVIPLPPIPPNTRNFASEWQRYDAMATNALLRADFLISDRWTFLVEAGYARTERDRLLGQMQNYNLTTGAGTLRVGYAPNLDYENKNVRAELFGRFLAGGARNDITFGVTSNERYQNSRAAGNRSFPNNYFNPVSVAEIGPPSVVTNNISTIYDTGIYAFDRISMRDDRLQFILGVRSTFYESETATTTYKKDNDVRPMVSGLYKPTKNSSVYVSYLQGPEQGGIAGLTLANAGELLPPLVSTQWEIGAKAELLEHTLVQIGLFEIERPSTFIDPASNRLTSNGLARYRGAELFVSGELTKRLSLVASALIMDAKQINAAQPSTFNKTPEGTAEKSGSLFLEWRTPVEGLRVSGGAFYVGERPVNNTNQGFVGGYTTLTAGLSYSFKVGNVNYTARLTGDNITDKNAWSTTGANLLGVTFPRIFKLNVTASF